MKSTHHFGRHLRTMLATTILGAMATLTASAQFQKSYDDNFSFSLSDQEVRPTSDGGYIQTGFVEYWGGATQVVLHKTDANGVRQWTRIIQSSNPNLNLTDRAYSVTPVTNFGSTIGYLIVGSTREPGGSAGPTDILVIRTNSTGNVLWRKAFIGGGNDVALDVQAIPSSLVSDASDFIITGYMNGGGETGQRMFLMRLDPFGNLMWCERYGRIPGSGYEGNAGNAVTYLPQSGGFAVAGYSNPDGAYNSKVPCVIKTTGNGTLLWGRTYNTPQNGTFRERFGEAKGIVEDGNGGDLIVTGWAQSYTSTSNNAFVARINTTTGVPTWFRTYNTKNSSGTSSNDFGFNVRRTSNGDLIMAGTTDYTGDAPHVFMVRLRSTGAISYGPRKYLLQSVTDPIYFALPEDASVSMHLSNAFIISANARTNGLYLIKTNALFTSGGCEETIPMEVDSLTPPRDTLGWTDRGVDTVDMAYEDLELEMNTDSCESEARKRVLFAGSELAEVAFSASSVTGGEAIRVTNLPTAGIYTVRVYNAVGKVVRTVDVEISETGGQLTVGTDDLRSGMYMIQVSHGQAITSHRITVTR